MKKLSFLLVLILLTSCAEDIIEKPENLISRDKMVTIFYDLAIVTAAKNTSDVVLKNNNIESMNYIFTKHDIDSIQFVKSDAYYASKTAVYKEIYQDVEARLKKVKAERGEQKVAKKKQDSISNKNAKIKRQDKLKKD
ncbi:DUF4296 domain-containing protein [Cellulophaga sp. HaHaR_3_176]|uniref:DUF4296 domain-containing protein n=1 Tax=Cellulophaga sp. HaHaR_3_176 TaxID=1942464 RepID=UPI001C1FA7CC|nr:DUF4296 domain-containing protein [Cellulophaga sp. HaHaR_3_176]QWX83238.1 DUF4296 domain-containing protein [Cellulophaga sp. HaHaR_3_176]